MKRKKKWIFYCEFCKKSSRSAARMARHEKACTMNPTRVCRMCAEYGDGTPQADIAALIAAVRIAKITETPGEYAGILSIEHQEEALDRLRKVSNGCPACMLAGIRQGTKHRLAFGKFYYHEERDAFWAAYNDIQAKHEGEGHYL